MFAPPDRPDTWPPLLQQGTEGRAEEVSPINSACRNSLTYDTRGCYLLTSE